VAQVYAYWYGVPTQPIRWEDADLVIHPDQPLSRRSWWMVTDQTIQAGREAVLKRQEEIKRLLNNP